MAEATGSDDRKNPLAVFLGASEGFLIIVLEAIRETVGDHPDGPLIAAHSAAANEQMGSLCAYASAHYSRSNAELKREVDEFMQMQAVTTLMRAGGPAFMEAATKGLLGDGAFAWVESVLQEIKKLIEWLSQIFHWPDWISKLIQLLDQILKAILGLFGGALGRSRTKIVAELSAMEVEFWNELAAHRRYVLLGSNGQAEAAD